MRPVLWLGEPNLHQDMGNDLVITWGDFNLNCDTISVLDYVEQHAIQLRRKYLSFIHDMGQNKVWNKTLVEYLLDRRGYNLWWMSQIAEKTYLNSPQITDCIKLFALEEILEKYNIKEITVYYEKSYKITPIFTRKHET